MELAKGREGGSGVGREGRAELRRVPVRPRVAEFIGTSGVPARAVEWIGGVTCGRGCRSRALRERPQPVTTVHARTDDVRLVIKDEHVVRHSVLFVCRSLVHFGCVHLEEFLPVHVVHRDESRGHATRAQKELAAGGPELLRGLVGQFLDPVLHVPLLLRLRMGHVLAIGDHPGGDGGLERLGLGRLDVPELLVAQPRILFAGIGGRLEFDHIRFTPVLASSGTSGVGYVLLSLPQGATGRAGNVPALRQGQLPGISSPPPAPDAGRQYHAPRYPPGAPRRSSVLGGHGPSIEYVASNRR